MKDKNSLYRLIIIIASSLGILLSSYMTYEYYSNAALPFCGVGSGCDSVSQSAYSTIRGIPVALFGVIGYFLILVFASVNMKKRNRWAVLHYISLAALTFSLYLTYLELFVINAICPYCVVSAIFVLVIFVVSILYKPKKPAFLSVKYFTLSSIVVLTVMFGSVILQSQEPQRIPPIDTKVNVGDSRVIMLAKHLASTGAVMYGTYWCPHCKQQKNMFGDAFKYITNVDCDPKALKDSNPELCKLKGIGRYPTWEINGKRYLGVKPLSELEYLSGFAHKYNRYR